MSFGVVVAKDKVYRRTFTSDDIKLNTRKPPDKSSPFSPRNLCLNDGVAEKIDVPISAGHQRNSSVRRA